MSGGKGGRGVAPAAKLSTLHSSSATRASPALPQVGHTATRMRLSRSSGRSSMLSAMAAGYCRAGVKLHGAGRRAAGGGGSDGRGALPQRLGPAWRPLDAQGAHLRLLRAGGGLGARQVTASEPARRSGRLEGSAGARQDRRQEQWLLKAEAALIEGMRSAAACCRWGVGACARPAFTSDPLRVHTGPC